MTNELHRAAIASCSVHVAFCVLMLISCGPMKINQNKSIEVEIAGIGDIEKEIGGIGDGELSNAQPMESTQEIKNESEIEPENIQKNDENRKNTDHQSPPVVENEKSSVNSVDSIIQSESIPVKKVETKPKNEQKPKIDKVDRPPKRKQNAIVDLVKKQKNVDKNFDDLLDSINDKDVLKAKKKKYNASSKVKGDGGGSGGDALSGGDYDLLKKQIMPNWFVPTGMQNYESYVVKLRISVQADGSLRRSDIEIEDIARYNSDRNYKIAADSAMRALLQASPLKLPRNVLRRLKKFLIVFDPRDAI